MHCKGETTLDDDLSTGCTEVTTGGPRAPPVALTPTATLLAISGIVIAPG